MLEKSGSIHCFLNHSYIITSDLPYPFKFLINEYIYLYIDLKFLYIKFSIESGYIKLANYHTDIFRIHYLEYMPKIEYTNSKQNIFNIFKQNKNLENKSINNYIGKDMKNKIYNAKFFISFFFNTICKMLKFLSKLK